MGIMGTKLPEIWMKMLKYVLKNTFENIVCKIAGSANFVEIYVVLDSKLSKSQWY